MNSSVWPLTAARPLEEPVFPVAAPGWVLLATALIVGLAFFLSEHDLSISLDEAYTATADEMELAAGGGNPFRRLAFLVVAGWGLLLLATSKERMRLDWFLAGAIGMLLVWAGMSVVWTDDVGMCVRRLIVLGCCVVAAAGIASRLSMNELCWLTVSTFGTLAVVGLLAEISLGTFRPWSADYRFAGSVHPNTQGPALAAICLATVGLARGSERGRIWLGAIFAAAFALLLLTKSRTTAAALVLALGAVALVQTRLRTKLAVGLAAAWVGSTALWLLMECGFDPLTDFRDALLLGRAEESETLTGRAFIWPEVLYFIGRRPWLGYGFEAFWTPARIEVISTDLGWGLREAHNAYLEMLLSLGLAGLVLTLSVVAAGLAASVRGFLQRREPAYALPLGLLVFGLINAGLESGMAAIELLTFLLGCCLLRMAMFGRSSLVIGHLHGDPGA